MTAVFLMMLYKEHRDTGPPGVWPGSPHVEMVTLCGCCWGVSCTVVAAPVVLVVCEPMMIDGWTRGM